MRPSIPPRPRQLLHAAIAAAWLAGCQVPAPAPTPEPSIAPSPAEIPPASPPPAPSTRPAPARDAPFLIVSGGTTSKAFRQLEDWAGAFAPGPAPLVHVKDVVGLTAKVAEARIPEILREFPDAGRIGLAFGGADVLRSPAVVEAFTVSLVTIARTVIADGREPLFARIPWSTQTSMAAAPSYNLAIAAVEAVVGLKPGPDFHAWFLAHPDQLERNGLTPTAEGEAAIRRLWAEKLATDAPAPAPTARPQIKPSTGVLLMLGDSITHQAFASLAGWPDHFPGGAVPAVRNFGVPGEGAPGAKTRLGDALALNPDAGLVGFAWGTNDITSKITVEAYDASMRAMVEQAREAGRIPILARIAYRSEPPLPAIKVFNARLDAIEREYRLPAGPDFYTWFEAHPDELSADGLHPGQAGVLSIRRMWAEAVVRAQKGP